MTKNIEIPLNLCQVLEEEYENLHRTLEDNQLLIHTCEEGSDETRSVMVRKDWRFHEGHVYAERLAATLETARENWEKSHPGEPPPQPGDAALQKQADLSTYLVFEYPNLSQELRSGALDGEGKPAYVATLNAILDATENVFRKNRFETNELTLRDETRALLELGWDGDEMEFTDSVPTGRSDLTRFKRLLLEDAFADELMRVYDVRLSRVIAEIHKLDTGQSAMCFSGGGIRSGSFALGVLQGLARHDFLDKFDYLSTVSGGGFTGGWLTAWIHRHPKGLRGVIEDLNGLTGASKLEPEPEPLRYLRDYSSFLVPRLGVLSADAWTFIAIYIRNLLLNWTVLIPLLLSVLMIPRIINAFVLSNPDKLSDALGLARSVIPTGCLVLGTLLCGYSIAFIRLNRPSSGAALRPGSFWAKRRGQRSFLKYCLLPLALSAALLTTYWAWHKRADEIGGIIFKTHPLSHFIIFGVVIGLVGVLLYLAFIALSWRRDEKISEIRGDAIVAMRWRRDDGNRKAGDETEAARKKLWQLVLQSFWELLVMLIVGVTSALLLYAATEVDIFSQLGGDAFVPSADAAGSSELLSFTKWSAEWYTCLAFSVYLLAFFLGTVVYVGFTSRRREMRPPASGQGANFRGASDKRGGSQVAWRPSWPYIEDEDREWVARLSAWLFITMISWSFFSTLVIFGPLGLLKLWQWALAAGGLSGLLTVLGGRSAKTPATHGAQANGGWKSVLAANALSAAAFVFLTLFVVVLSLLTSASISWLATKLPHFAAGSGFDRFRQILEIPAASYNNFARGAEAAGRELVYRTVHYPSLAFLVGIALLLFVAGQFMARRINLNKFSLHAGYRDRIIRAFLGASRLKGERRENPFTGFDPSDNLYMSELRPGLLSESDFRAPDGLRKFADRLREVDNLDGEAASTDEHLRQQIQKIGGQSEPYFGTPSADTANSSFKAALFADLNHILQTDRLEDSAHFARFISADNERGRRAARASAQLQNSQRSDYRILLNRMLLEQAYDEEMKQSSYPPPPYRLLHVVNMTLNLVGGARLAWQSRRAESFTSTPLHSGSLYVGYRRARDYGGRHGVSLGTVVAVSGAAASSNMGYYSPSAVVTLAMTLLNARLGWWLGNPGVKGNDTYYLSHPRKALSPIIDEAFGMTDDQNPYVLLSDGGHFENLGLYEMVLRRCRNIVVVDGSADPEGILGDLGGAVRKIRIDMGIPIEFDPPFSIYPRPQSEDKKGGYCVVGNIYYGAVDGNLDLKDSGGKPLDLTGKLIYIKPTFYGIEPRDVYNYAKGSPTFPHESTADQFFDEPQFESHRMLGSYIVEQLCGSGWHEHLAPDCGDTGGGRFGGRLDRLVAELEKKAEAERLKMS
ncbi:MAG TPA: patatin-like phospholipase family protein [Pyrinomonadaceae bacterium]|nr:patatin-like phospholipase family protein [Pyrinomonadaceae bacterium]